MPSSVTHSHSLIPLATLQGYLETEYRVLGDAPFTLRIDTASPALAALHGMMNVPCSAFITAWNPLSVPPDDLLANTTAQRALQQDIAQLGLTTIDGIGQHPSGNWPGEASLLVMGLKREAAASLARHYRQNALIWCGADAVPRLMLLR